MALEAGRPASSGSRFVILSLPRSGSTSLARLVNAHPGIRCLFEPFYIRNYGGKYHALVNDAPTVDSALDSIWREWNGIKHVWQSFGWPFYDRPEIEDRIALAPGHRVIYIMRRNLLRRWVSTYLARQMEFWVGTREQFYARLATFQVPAVDVEEAREEIASDRAAMEHRLQSLRSRRTGAMVLYYEDVYREEASEMERFAFTNRVLGFLDFSPVTLEMFRADFQQHLNPDIYRWASPELYRRIPGIERIEEECGSDQTGWLFR
jgi:hypothetical protein